MKAKRATTMLMAAGLAFSSVATNAASSLSITRAAPAMSGVSYLQDDDDDDGGGSTAIILGVVLVVLIGAAAISGNSSEPSQSP